MKTSLKKTFYLALIATSTLFSSCSLLDNESTNYQTFTGIVGTIVTKDNQKYFQTDNGSDTLSSSTFNANSFKSGDRLIISATIDYNKQNPNTSYLIAEIGSVVRIDQKQTSSFDTPESDTLSNDAVINQTWSYIVNANNQYFYTAKTYFYASNLSHTIDLANNRVNLNDTLKFEIRHNRKSDDEAKIQVENLTTFDITSFLDTVPVGKTKIIQISYKTDKKVLKQIIAFKKKLVQ